MSLTISLDPKESPENVNCHLLPCKVNHNGSCKVEKYFDPYIRNHENILNCSLRGHPLQGQKIEVPDGYKGVVLKEKKIVSEGNRELEEVSTFKEFSFWNWDKLPSDNDKIMKALQWIDVSSALHKPVSQCEDIPEMESFKTGVKRKSSDNN